MNIDSIKNYPTGIPLKHRNMYGLEDKRKSTSADLCNDKKINRGYYSGSFTGINVAAAAGSIPPVNPGKISILFDKILKLCDEKTVVAQNLVAFVLAAILRPIAIMSLPGKKDKDDKKYASGHSIASGLIAFGFSTIVMSPLDKAAKMVTEPVSDASIAIQAMKDIKDGKPVKEKILKKIDKIKEKYKISDLSELENIETFKKLKKTYNAKDLVELEHSKAYQNVTRILKMAPDTFVFGILRAMLTIALIPPILKYGFCMEKKKAPQTGAATANTGVNSMTPPPAVERPEITKFAGGLK